ncbi:hypothetical protein AABB24_011736 [Solanum stoloniferum]|uniref:Uncharacterized protein n=1 Tax=Solanum stoloniferum TaxID=62892 RepID=A0ABD2UHY7_9SOLN
MTCSFTEIFSPTSMCIFIFLFLDRDSSLKIPRCRQIIELRIIQYSCLILLIAIWSGCCKPPTECGYTYLNETVWNPGSGIVGSDPDCGRWSNYQQQLCYNCNSCKAGVLASLKKSWRKVSVINIVILIILVIMYMVAIAAFRHNKRIDNDEPYGETRMEKSQPSRIHF